MLELQFIREMKGCEQNTVQIKHYAMLGYLSLQTVLADRCSTPKFGLILFL